MSGHAASHLNRLDARDRQAADAWERFARGEAVRGGVRADILLSWHRSRDDYRVNPSRESAPVAADGPQSTDGVVVAAELGAAAIEIAADVEAIGGVVSVADGTGRVLSAWGERRAVARARDQNLGPWFGWSESATGTTGIGLALESRGPVGVVGAEHWCSVFQDWSCNAVAVRDPATNESVGVIAISAWRRTLPETTLAPLVQAVHRVERRLHERLPQAQRPVAPRRAASAPARIAATHAGRMIVVLAHEIQLAEFVEGVVWLQTERGRVRAIARNLLELEQKLDGAPFVRISRQVLVNADCVREVTRSRSRGVWIGLDGGDVLLPVSRRRVPELRQALNVS
ncbi:MAG: putative helix-turn-helix, Fis-type [Actinomycetia bacterium]|nr:putative helix-turn-helix, Fis-type [Actinomycetes bacterium]